MTHLTFQKSKTFKVILPTAVIQGGVENIGILSSWWKILINK